MTNEPSEQYPKLENLLKMIGQAGYRMAEIEARIRRRLGDRAGPVLSLNTLADVMLDEGEFSKVRPIPEESLEINRELGDKTAIAYLIEDYAGLAAAESKPEKALQLASFSVALRESIGAPLPPLEQARVDRMIAPAREALPEANADAEWQAG